MKKILSFFLTICLCLSTSALFVSCNLVRQPTHHHTYATEWSKDATHHWHACEDESCTEVSDKAEHTFGEWKSVGGLWHEKTCACGAFTLEDHEWNDGKITTPPTIATDGVMTYTCAVCGETYTETVPCVPGYTVTAEEWANAFQFRGMEYTIQSVNDAGTYTTFFDGSTVKIENASSSGSLIERYFTKEGDLYFVTSRVDGEVSKQESTAVDYANARCGAIGEMFVFSNFVYDEETKSYKAIDDIVLINGTIVYSNVELFFENGRFMKATLEYSLSYFDSPRPCTYTVTYGDVETIVVPVV